MLENIKKRFPVFEKNHNLVFLDTAASALKVDSMIKATNNLYSYEYSNIHRGLYDLSAKLSKRFEESRKNISQFINSPSENNIIFTKSATEGINLISTCLDKEYFNDGDEIIVTHIEHHANLVPWHLIKKNIKIIPAELKSNLEIDYDDLINKINSKTKLVAVTHMSNVTGAITDISKFNYLLKKNNIPLLLDGCQFVPHKKINLKEIDPDFYVFSAHKLYGPSGLGILYMKDKWIDRLSPYQGGGSMIKEVEIEKSSYLEGYGKFEAGTPPIAQVIGLNACIDFINEIGIENIYSHENKLTKYAYKKLKNLKSNNIQIHCNPLNVNSILSFSLDGINANDIGILLNNKNIAIRTGHHCAQPLMKKLDITGSARLSFGIYNNYDDIDNFIESLEFVINFFN